MSAEKSAPGGRNASRRRASRRRYMARRVVALGIVGLIVLGAVRVVGSLGSDGGSVADAEGPGSTPAGTNEIATTGSLVDSTGDSTEGATSSSPGTVADTTPADTGPPTGEN